MSKSHNGNRRGQREALFLGNMKAIKGKAWPPPSTKFSRPLDFFGHTAACRTEYLCTFVGAYRFSTGATLPNRVHYLVMLKE